MFADTVQQIFEHHSRPITRADAQQNRDTFRRASVGRAAHALAGRNHLFDLCCRHHVLIRTEAPLGLVHRIKMGKSRAQHRGRHIERITICQRSGEITRLPIERRYGRARANVDERILRAAFDHTADCILRPLIARYEFRVTGQNRRAAERVFLFNENGRLTQLGERMSGRESGGTCTDNEDRFTHAWCSIRIPLKPGPEVIMRRGSYRFSCSPPASICLR